MKTKRNKKAATSTVSLATAPHGLKEIRLPVGDVGSVNIGWMRNGASINLDPQSWLGEGYKGVRLIGAGVDRTVLRCTAWDGVTLGIGRHPGVVQVEGVTLVAGSRCAAAVGEQNLERWLTPQFQFRFLGSRTLAPEPAADGARSVWGLFGYQADVYLADVELDHTHGAEHASYWHGFAKFGLLWVRVNARGAGSQLCKVRNDAYETAWAGPLASVTVRDSRFRNSGQAWGWRGDGMIVCEGSGVPKILVEDSAFFGGAPVAGVGRNFRSHAIMISSEGNSYDAVTGAAGTGYGNGDVLIRRCAVKGHSDVDWRSEQLYCARNGGSQLAARSYTVDGCGLYGQGMRLIAGNVPSGKTIVRGCNTPAIRDICGRLGMDTSSETLIPTATRLMPVSEGLVR